jgi:hypothetical protein
MGRERPWKGVIRERRNKPGKGELGNEGSMMSLVTEDSSNLRTESYSLDMRIRKWLMNSERGISTIQSIIMQQN